jgi:hypothetical protein
VTTVAGTCDSASFALRGILIAASGSNRGAWPQISEQARMSRSILGTYTATGSGSRATDWSSSISKPSRNEDWNVVVLGSGLTFR